MVITFRIREPAGIVKLRSDDIPRKGDYVRLDEVLYEVDLVEWRSAIVSDDPMEVSVFLCRCDKETDLEKTGGF